MRVALHDVDSVIPNLALLKLSAHHRALGDEVVLYDPLFRSRYDKVYASKVFDFSDAPYLDPATMEVGGTGWDLSSRLPEEVEVARPMPEDYALWGYPHSLGFTMRGCRFRCPFCVVPEKEGRPYAASTVESIWTNRSDLVVLLDNDFFGGPEWRERIGELRELRLRVNFNQGINIRLITDEQAEALASVRFTNRKASRDQVHFAWDRPRDEGIVLKGIERCRRAGIELWKMAFYVLVGYDTTPEQDLHRVALLAELGCDPYVMPYDRDDPYQNRFARWVNHKAVFRAVSWEDYAGSKKKGPPGLEGQLEIAWEGA